MAVEAGEQEHDDTGQFESIYEEQDYLIALAFVADKTDSEEISERTYERVRRESDPQIEQVRNWAGSWTAAARSIGAETVGNGYSRGDFAHALQYTGGRSDGALSQSEHDRLRREQDPSARATRKTFGDGSWNRAKFRAGLSEFERISGEHYSPRVQGPVHFLRDASGRLRMYDVGSVEVVVTTRKQNSDAYHRPRLSSAFPDGENPPEPVPLCSSRMSKGYTFRRQDVLFDDMSLCGRCEKAEARDKQ